MEKNDPLISNIDNNSIQHDSQNKDPNETIISNSQNSIKNANNYKNMQFSKLEEYEEGKKVKKWVNEEDKNLKQLVEQFGEKNWRQISQCMKNRTPIQCLHRWTKILKPGLVKGPWSPEEDQKLIQWINEVGAQKWSQCSDQIPGRSGKQCRERWFNNLNPDVKKGNWTQAEDDYIFQGYLLYGSSWSKIAKELVGRTENSVKNRFYSTVRKLLSDSQFKQLKQQSKNDQKDKDIFKDILKKHIKQNIDQSESQTSSQELGQSQEQQQSTYQNNDNKNDENQSSKQKDIEQVKIENQEIYNDLNVDNINCPNGSEQNPQSFLTKRKYSKVNKNLILVQINNKHLNSARKIKLTMDPKIFYIGYLKKKMLKQKKRLV
ncbi:Homeodomain protein [Pseudocohnilembus persalinus]|uniref:Homeodomain protein n=1 Tax=Pseudocohnilembus persalinus TaxID=266149 RepID=A0A0V0QLT2_PSEPJ|nr:Homeodomain protein [Pseudocohnilembus persalinus]|eukprot:KRX03321.1 Homeodomain protein [Pseudocohnilembus persalinus]